MAIPLANVGEGTTPKEKAPAPLGGGGNQPTIPVKPKGDSDEFMKENSDLMKYIGLDKKAFAEHEKNWREGNN